MKKTLFTLIAAAAFSLLVVIPAGATIIGGTAAAVPEPGTAYLFAVGLAAMDALAKRSRYSR
jgi:hypothetical protein